MGVDERLESSVKRAQSFLEDGAGPVQLWSDFTTLAGESFDWVSGYVGYALARSDSEKTQVGGSLLHDAATNLSKRQHGDGGWGYGPGVPADADSTSWCLLFLSETEVLGQESLGRGLSFLKRHQSSSDGGFRTYAEPREIGRYMMLDEQTSFEGWASSQPCVTAAAAQALTKTGSPGGSSEAFDYIRRAQTPEGGWNAYWWTDPLYSTLLCMEALALRGREEDRPAVERARGWIARSQLATGGWYADGWPFSTGLALSGLLLGPPSTDYLAALQRGAEWLLAAQLEDGSWGEHHILRIPHPSAKEPWTQTDWTLDGKAINAAIRDQRRLYTTATVFKALSEYRRKTSEGGWRPQ